MSFQLSLFQLTGSSLADYASSADCILREINLLDMQIEQTNRTFKDRSISQILRTSPILLFGLQY